MKGFTNIMKHSLLRLATILSILLVGVFCALTASVASVSGINNDVIVNPKVDVNVVLPANQAVRPFAVRPFGFKPPFGFRPFGFMPPFGFKPPLGFNPNGIIPLFDEESE